MNTSILIEAFSEFKDSKNIDKETMMRVLEDVFRSLIIKKYGSDENIDVITNTDKGDLEIIRRRLILDDDDVVNDNFEIAYSDAIKIQSDFQVGEEFYEDIDIDQEFGRRAVMAFGQNLKTKILEIQKESIYKKYKDRVGDIIVGEVSQAWKKDIAIMDEDGNELRLPRLEQIPSDFFKKGDTVKAVISRVEIRNTVPIITLSRIDDLFLEKMLEQEVPEIEEGLITIKAIARIPGEKAKIAVETYDDRIDPVGSVVGVNGSRIKGIVKELRGENIDVVNYSSNINLFIARALSPAKVGQVKINEDRKKADVELKADQVSLAIGKNGSNIKLAAKITGYQIDVFRDDEDYIDDVNLSEFTDEIDAWIIDEFKKIGCDTAKSVLAISAEELVRRTDLEEDTVTEILNILKSEFE